MIPQMILSALITMSVCHSLVNDNKYQFIGNVSGNTILILLLYWGGFFGGNV